MVFPLFSLCVITECGIIFMKFYNDPRYKGSRGYLIKDAFNKFCGIREIMLRYSSKFHISYSVQNKKKSFVQCIDEIKLQGQNCLNTIATQWAV